MKNNQKLKCTKNALLIYQIVDRIVEERAERVNSLVKERAKRVDSIVKERAKRVDSLVKERAKRVNSIVIQWVSPDLDNIFKGVAWVPDKIKK